MIVNNLSAIILTYNEEDNIHRTLNQLNWIDDIIIIDSGSSDQTLSEIRKFQNVTIYEREFDNHTNQWNYGLNQATTEWVLSLDADYLITKDLQLEISKIDNDTHADGFYIPFRYCVFGKPLRGTILPPRLALFRKSKAQYIEDGHTQSLKLNGKASHLNFPIWHDDRKSLSRWLWAQDRYMKIEAKKITESSFEMIGWGDRVRKKIIIAPFIVFIYCLIVKGGILDGWHGWYYAFQRMFAELLLSIRLIEYRIR